MITPLVLSLVLGTAPADPKPGFPSRWDAQLDVVDTLFPIDFAPCPVTPLCSVGLSAQATWRLTSWGLFVGGRQHLLWEFKWSPNNWVFMFATEASLGVATPDTARWQAFGGLLGGVKWGVVASINRGFQKRTLVDSYTGWAARPSVKVNVGGRFFITPRVGIVVQGFWPLYDMLPDIADNNSTLLSVGVTWIL